MKQAYLKSGYCEYFCSECGVRYSDREYYEGGYTLDNILTKTVKCKKCGALFSEKPKRCYYSDYNSTNDNACGECINLNGVDICTQQTAHRTKELQSWGCYYPCKYYNPKEAEQLTFWEV